MPSDGVLSLFEGSIEERMLDASLIDHIDLPLKLIPKAHIIIIPLVLFLLHSHRTLLLLFVFCSFCVFYW